MVLLNERNEDSASSEEVPYSCRNVRSSSSNLLQSESDQKEGCDYEAEPCRPLGLKLNKTPSFLSMVELKLSEARRKKVRKNKKQIRSSSRETSRSKTAASNEEIERTKASNFPALSVKIGSWQRNQKHQGDLIAKCYYGKKKMVWEFLDMALKSKIEIQWDDITAIRATLHDHEPGILEIELKTQPLFFRETNPQPRKHTLWQPSKDFTGGQAHKCRRHYAWFPAGTLGKPYEKLLQCDSRLLELSKRPFPSSESPYFDSDMYENNGISLDFSSPQMQYPFSTTPLPFDLQSPVQSLRFGTDDKSPFSIVNFQPREVCSYEYMLQSETRMQGLQGGKIFQSHLLDAGQLQERQESRTPVPTHTSVTYSGQGHHTFGYHEAAPLNYDPSMEMLYGTDNNMADDSQILSLDRISAYESINPMWSLLGQYEYGSYGYNTDMTGLGYKQENFGANQTHFSENLVSDSSHAYSQPFGSLPPLISDTNLMMQLDNNLSYQNDSM